MLFVQYMDESHDLLVIDCDIELLAPVHPLVLLKAPHCRLKQFLTLVGDTYLFRLCAIKKNVKHSIHVVERSFHFETI